ncbi:MAG TPA: GAP family protein [Solirubrobacteraceae bacterium]
MGEAIAEVLALGVGVALSPLAIIAVVLMLAAPRGRRSGAAFLVGWVLALGAVGTIALLIADVADADADGSPATWVSIVKIVLGVLLLVVAARQLRRRAGDTESELPGWMRRLDGITPARSAGLAVVLAAVKPKNLLLTVAAGVAIAQTGASPAGQAVALAVFVLLGGLAPGVPVAIHVLMGERGPGILAAMREWMLRENDTIIAVLCLVLAVKLIGDAV